MRGCHGLRNNASARIQQHPGLWYKKRQHECPFLLEMSTPTHQTPPHILAGSEECQVVYMFWQEEWKPLTRCPAWLILVLEEFLGLTQTLSCCAPGGPNSGAFLPAGIIQCNLIRSSRSRKHAKASIGASPPAWTSASWTGANLVVVLTTREGVPVVVVVVYKPCSTNALNISASQPA